MKCEICGKSNASLTVDDRYMCEDGHVGYARCSDCGRLFPPEMEGSEGGKCIQCCNEED